MTKAKGFTPIELLIVVAIIAILAAIAVPNFLEAQTRAKTSRVKSDMRTVATAVEAYKIDNNNYPTMRAPRPVAGDTSSNETLGREVTTPIAYITSLSITNDVFKRERVNLPPGRELYHWRNYEFLRKVTVNPSQLFLNRADGDGSYRIVSAGPDRFIFSSATAIPAADFNDFGVVNYDPTNGTVSRGDIFRTQKYTDRSLEIVP